MIDVETGADLVVAEWWGDHVSFDARPGGRLTERWTDTVGREVLTSGEVVRLTAPRTLELMWADDNWDETTRVLFRVNEAAGATRLALEHSGWGAFPSPVREELVHAHASGRSHHMANLAAYSAQ